MDAEVVEVDLTSPAEKPRRPPPTPPASPLVRGAPKPISPQSAVHEHRSGDWSSASSCHYADDPVPKQPQTASVPPAQNLTLEVLRMLAQQQQDAYGAKLREVASHELRLKQWEEDLVAKEASLRQWEQRLKAAPENSSRVDRYAPQRGGGYDDTMGSVGGGELSFAERLRIAKAHTVASVGPDRDGVASSTLYASRRL